MSVSKHGLSFEKQSLSHEAIKNYLFTLDHKETIIIIIIIRFFSVAIT